MLLAFSQAQIFEPFRCTMAVACGGQSNFLLSPPKILTAKVSTVQIVDVFHEYAAFFLLKASVKAFLCFKVLNLVSVIY